MELPAIGPKMMMMMMAQKVSWMLQKMFSGFTQTPSTHGIREGSKEDRPDEAKVKAREKEKAEEEEEFSSQGKEKAEEKVKKRPSPHGGCRRI